MDQSSFTKEQLIKESIFKVGVVFSVSGRRVKVRVNKNKNASHLLFQGEILKNISVNSYIKITKWFTKIIGKVEWEFIEVKKVYNREYNKEEDLIERYLEVSLFGHFEWIKFHQWIKEMPLVDNECFLLDKEEFESLHQFHKNWEKTITIWTLTEEPSQTIKVSIDRLFASHIGIFGNTWSGKSNTLARLYMELFKEMQDTGSFKENSKFIIIDFNGEYWKNGDQIITNNKKVYVLNTGNTDWGDKIPLKLKDIEDIEIISILLEATEKTQKPFLDYVLKNTYFNEDFELRSRLDMKQKIKDLLQKWDVTQGLSIFSDYLYHIEKIETIPENWISKTGIILEKLRNGELKPFQSKYRVTISGLEHYSDSSIEILYSHIFGDLDTINLKSDNFSKLKFRIISQYYHSVITGHFNQEHIKPLMWRMFKKFRILSKVIEITEADISDNLTVINLKDVNTEMKKTLPLLLAKKLYEEHKSKEHFKKQSLHIIIDEAHNILSNSSKREGESWKDYRLETFEEIIKEWRKFNTFLTIASQRPHDISETIISQLHNYFIHKLINDFDINAVHKTVAYLDKLSFESIPILSTWSCFFAWLATNLPVKVSITPLNEENKPDSGTVSLEKIWEEQTEVNVEWDDEMPEYEKQDEEDEQLV